MNRHDLHPSSGNAISCDGPEPDPWGDLTNQPVTVQRGRKRGPGGQNRNKVETAITLTHQATGVTASASERRSQAENLHMAAKRLQVNLALEVRGTFQLRQIPSARWNRRVGHDGRMAVNPDHEDFAPLLAEALDALAYLKYDPAKAAMILSVTASQLIKLIKQEPKALAWLNAQRRQRHLHGFQ